ncbi:lipopolysaccharide biosynthesis protein [Roseateles sp.]|uniref:lipopolysaccharide biosynthesis protein n=1 Tax=Roseateles sp. TaxID=1971397 RepID=UPI0032669613
MIDLNPDARMPNSAEPFRKLLPRWRLLVAAPLIAAGAAFGISYLIAPTFTARTTFIPPQQQQSSAAAALNSLGALSSLAGSAAGIKNLGDQLVSLLASANVEDRIIDKFKLMEVYDARFRVDARRELEQNVRANLGKRDGLITIDVDAKSPELAADIANQFVLELQRLTSDIALTEAQQRRVFFEAELKSTKQRLGVAQRALQASGFNSGDLKAEPKAAAEDFARLKAEETAAQVRLQVLRRSLTESSAEVQRQSAMAQALKAQVARLERTGRTAGNADYVTTYREYKYQEALFDLFAKQYEMARLDESRDSLAIQIVDKATPPERKSKPRRLMFALAGAGGAFFILVGCLLLGIGATTRPVIT